MADFITIIPQSTFNDTQKLLKEVNAIADGVERVNKEAKKIKFPSEARGVIEKTNEEITKTNKLLSDTEVIRKRQQSSIRNLTVARSKENKEIQKNRLEANQLNKTTKQEEILTNKLIGAYQKLNLRRTQAETRLKNLIVSERASNREIRKAQREFDRLDKRIRKANGAVKSGTLDVGRYKIALGGARVNALRFASALGFTGILFGIARGFTEAIRTIREFDAQLIAVGKTTGLEGAALDDFAQKAIDLGLRLKGISIKGLLETAEVAGQLGIKGTESILKFSEAVEKLRITSNVNSEETIRDFAKFIQVSSDTAENADRLGSVITKLGNNFATTETQIISNATEIQKGTALFNTSAESVLGLGAATNALGAEAEASRTAVQKTFIVINKAINTGKGLEDILRITGLTQKELSEQFNKDAVGVFVKFIGGLSKIQKGGGDVTAQLDKLQLSNVRVNTVVGALAKNFDVLDSAVSQANQEYIDNVAANEEVEAATKSLNSIIGDAKDAWDAFVLSIDKGDGVISRFIRSAVTGLTEFLGILRSVNQGRAETLQLSSIEEAAIKNQEKLFANFKKQTSNRLFVSKQTIKTVEELAKKRLKSSTDSIKGLNSEIATIEKRNAAIVKREKEENFLEGVFSKTGSKAIEDNQKKIDKLTQSIARQTGIQKASTAQLTKKTKVTKELTEEEKAAAVAADAADDGKKKGIAAINGSIAAIQNQIKTLKELQSKTSTTEAQFKSFNDQIGALEGLLLTITGISGVEADIVPITPEQVDLIKDAQSAMNEYFGIVDRTKENTKALQDATDDFLESFTSGFLADAGLDSLTQFFDGTFNKLLAGAESVEERFAVTFNSIAQVAQEAFSFIEQAQANSIQKQLNDLETQKEIEIALAGGNAEAIANINAQADLQERAIKQKQAEQNKKNAIFNIAINTAQGVVAALASVPPNVPLSIAIGVIGALQAALVASTPIPQFKDGVRGFEGGLAVVGDGGVPEVVSTPNSTFITPSKPTVMNLPENTDVYKNVREFDTSLNSVLMQNRINPVKSSVSNGISAGQMDKIFEKNMKKMTALNLNMDQNGFAMSLQKGLSRTAIKRNRVTFKGKKV